MPIFRAKEWGEYKIPSPVCMKLTFGILSTESLFDDRDMFNLENLSFPIQILFQTV